MVQLWMLARDNWSRVSAAKTQRGAERRNLAGEFDLDCLSGLRSAAHPQGAKIGCLDAQNQQPVAVLIPAARRRTLAARCSPHASPCSHIGHDAGRDPARRVGRPSADCCAAGALPVKVSGSGRTAR